MIQRNRFDRMFLILTEYSSVFSAGIKWMEINFCKKIPEKFRTTTIIILNMLTIIIISILTIILKLSIITIVIIIIIISEIHFTSILTKFNLISSFNCTCKYRKVLITMKIASKIILIIKRGFHSFLI